MTATLRRIHLQSGIPDTMGRPIQGLFEILLDDNRVVEIMERAAANKSRQSRMGAVVVRYKPITKAQADYIVKNPGAAQ